MAIVMDIGFGIVLVRLARGEVILDTLKAADGSRSFTETGKEHA
jgi:hypothetical protein